MRKNPWWTRYQIFNEPTSVLLIFFFCLGLQCGSARHFLDSHSLPFWWSATVSAHNEMCQGDTLCWLHHCVLGWGVGRAPRAQARGAAIQEGQGALRMHPGGRFPKPKKEALTGAQTLCWNHYLSAHRNIRAMYRVFTFLQAPIQPCILKMGSLPWNSEILHFLFYQTSLSW